MSGYGLFHRITAGEVSTHEGAECPGEFIGQLAIAIALDDPGRAARLTAPLSFITSYRYCVTAPTGMRTDLASLPLIARAFLSKLDRTAWAAVIHDHLYQTHQVTHVEADFIFFEALLSAGVVRWQARLYWAAVRLGGKNGWDRDRRRANREYAYRASRSRSAADVSKGPSRLYFRDHARRADA